MAKPKPVDLICCHGKNGEVMPIRIRMQDEDGQYQAYAIKEYKDISHRGVRMMPDGVFVTEKTLIFECKISVFGCEKQVHLYSNDPYLSWQMTLLN